MNNFETFENSLVQVNSTTCKENILKNVKEIPLKQLYNKRIDKLLEMGCENDTNIGNVPLYQYNPKIFTKIGKRCVDKFDKEFLENKINKHPSNYDISLDKGLNKLLKEKCIYFFNNKPKSTDQLFLLTTDYIPNEYRKNPKEYFKNIGIGSVKYNNILKDDFFYERIILTHSIYPVLGQYFLYKVKYQGKEKIKNNNIYNMKDLSDFSLIYESDKDAPRTQKISGNSIVYSNLYSYMNKYIEVFPSNVISEFEKINIVPNEPVKVYRGLVFDYPNVFTRNYKVGDTFEFYSLGKPMSWSSSYCVAKTFSVSKQYGILLSTTLKPEDVLIDTRQIIDSEAKRLYKTDQQEIISKPYRVYKKDSLELLEESKFTVKVEELQFNYKDDIISLRGYDNQPTYKDICIVDSTIGEPISKIEAISKFFNKEAINMDILPQSQEDLLLLEKQKIRDPNNNEEIDLSECWQYSEDGFIIPIKRALDIIRDNTNEWMGMENVGFKNLLSGCIYGNLVNYGYDNVVNFPQANGILLISLMNKKLIVEYKKDKKTFYKFESGNKNVVLEYPNTIDGKRTVMLMIDSFLKNNLFAMSLDGFVKSERVNQLYELGSTPYIVGETGRMRYKQYIENKVLLNNITIDELFNSCLQNI